MTSDKLEHLVPYLPLYFGDPQFALLKLASSANTNVLLVGTPGFPFELGAEVVHFLGNRSGKPFLTADHILTSTPECETALFGKVHIFVEGPRQFHKGLVQAANGGTLYFGDLTFLPSHIQLELMNVVDRGSVIPIGSTDPVVIDVRLIAATDRNPDQSLQNGILRKDFYYWISTITITMASINDRRHDIPPLADHLLHLFAEKHRKAIQGFTPDAMDLLKSFVWSGEIRQLENAVERSVILCGETNVSPTHLPAYVINAPKQSSKRSAAKTLREASADFQRQFIIDTMRECYFAKEQAAFQLGISVSSLYRKLEELNISDGTPAPDNIHSSDVQST